MKAGDTIYTLSFHSQRAGYRYGHYQVNKSELEEVRHKQRKNGSSIEYILNTWISLEDGEEYETKGYLNSNFWVSYEKALVAAQKRNSENPYTIKKEDCKICILDKGVIKK